MYFPLNTHPLRRTCFQGSPARTTPIPFTSSSADASILPIVTSQRDRFRQRNAELEEVTNTFSSPSITFVLTTTLRTGTAKTIPGHNRPPNGHPFAPRRQPQALRESTVHAKLPVGRLGFRSEGNAGPPPSQFKQPARRYQQVSGEV